MASNLKYSAALKNAQQDAISTAAGASAKIGIFSGAQPANPDTAITSQVLLAEPTGNAGGFAPAASGGVLTAAAITSATGTAGAGSGTTATWFRVFKADGVTGEVDGTVGVSGADMNLNNTSIANGQTVSITSFTLTNAQ